MASSSVAAQTSPVVVSTPAVDPSTTPVAFSTLQPTGSIPKGTPTGLVSTASSDHTSADAASTSAPFASGELQSNIPSGSSAASSPLGGIQTNVPSGSSTLQLTTSTVLSTRTATITACPTTVPNCPANSKTTFVTTETIVVSTTICPVTEAAGATQTSPASPSATGNAGGYGNGNDGSDFTTSTVYSTRTATITACPSSVTNCPLRSKTTYLTTETLVVSTTICPVSEATGTSGAIATNPAGSAATTEAAQQGDNGGSELTTSTIFATHTATVLACPESVTDCPLRSKTRSATTQTVAVATTVYPVVATQASIPAGVTGTVTAVVTAANNQASDANGSSQSNAGSDVDATYTTTIVVESCSDDDTCTGYINSIVMTQTGAAASTATPSSYVPHFVSGAGNNRTVSASASSTPIWSQTSQSSGMVTATVSSTTSAVSPLYTGAASARAGWSILQMVGSAMVVLAAVVVV